MGDPAFWSGAGAAFLSIIIGSIFTLIGGYLQARQALKAANKERFEGLYHDLFNEVWELQKTVETYKQGHVGSGISEAEWASIWGKIILGSEIIDKALLILDIVLQRDHKVRKLIREWRNCYQHLLNVVVAAKTIQDHDSQKQVVD